MMNLIILTLAFLILAVLIYQFVKPYLRQASKSDVPKGVAYIHFFYTDWCGHSKSAQPHWNKLEDTLAKTPYFGDTKVIAKKVDCEQDRETCDEYDVEGYPTVKLEAVDGIREFNKKVTHENLLSFLRNELGKESESL
jgi:thiol-disulfide isomerase/thioredoxin